MQESHTRRVTHTQPHTHGHKLTHTVTNTHTRSQTHTHGHKLTHGHTRSHTVTHTHTHANLVDSREMPALLFSSHGDVVSSHLIQKARGIGSVVVLHIQLSSRGVTVRSPLIQSLCK